MSQRDKLIRRFRSRPSDFTWQELVRLLESLGYSEVATGSTSGSRCRFVHTSGAMILLHRPHPGNVVKMYVLDAVRRSLSEEGLL
jgi:predicted RNA binding protein YcfA (HicA-like mRNA interferase family)